MNSWHNAVGLFAIQVNLEETDLSKENYWLNTASTCPADNK